MLTIENFLKKISELDICIGRKSKDKYALNPIVKKNIAPEHYLYIEWVVGGESGGSCWNQGEYNHCAINADVEPDFTDLDTILLFFCPDISYLQYKILASSVITYDEYTIPEYYGNYTDYKVKKVVLESLYNKLVEMKLI